MNDPKRQKTCHKKVSTDANYSDHWGTPKCAYELLVPHVRHWQEVEHRKDTFTIWDPFFCKGHAKEYLEQVFGPLGATVIHSNAWVDITDTTIPEFAQNADLIITNPPYSKTNKLDTTLWLKELGLPFFSIMPTEFMMAKKFRPHIEPFQFICPSGRVRFERDGVVAKTAPLSSTWYVCGVDLVRDISFCK
tara:strand:- start:15748 stop:16320 length:573 start_codon:yes stop_codon:yes gene_type:complete